MTFGITKQRLRIAIIGGGIGGLTLAIGLRQRGMVAEVFEQTSELTEIGAAVALSANATRELRRLGVLDAITAVSTEPTELIYREWGDGHGIASHRIRLDFQYRKRFGAPYFGLHRADLQRILSAPLGRADLHLGYRLVNVFDESDSIALEFSNGVIAQADLVVSADGVRSAVRQFVTGTKDTVYSGTSALRGIVPVMARQSGRKRRVDQDEKKRPDESMIVARGNVWQVLIVAARRSTPDHQR